MTAGGLSHIISDKNFNEGEKMERAQTFNFAAGPSVLPTPVLEQAQRELLNYQGSGMSVMEMSHRSAGYQEIFADEIGRAHV